MRYEGFPMDRGDEGFERARRVVLAATVVWSAAEAGFIRAAPVEVSAAADVECVVLSSDAPNASLLLGMSFLGNFDFRINAEAGLLTMVEIDDGKQE